MEARNVGYSMKNILIPPKQCYLKGVVEKVGSFNTRLSWKAHFFDKNERPINNMNFGFKSYLTPPHHELLSPLESDLYDMIRSINFKPVRSDFQNKLADDITSICLKTYLFFLARPRTYVK